MGQAGLEPATDYEGGCFSIYPTSTNRYEYNNK